MTINRNAREKFNRTLQANAREFEASLSKPHPQANKKTSNQLDSSHFREQLPPNHDQDSMMMTRPMRQSKPTAATNDNNNLAPNPARSKPLTAMNNRQTTPTASQMAQQQQPQQEVWNSTEDLFWDHMREVQNKWNTLKLNDDIWAKLIYFEQNRRLAKAYVSTPVLTIDGSTNGLDGFRIGLSGIENSYRNLDSIACLRSIGQGIRLKIDQQGNILIRKLVPVLKANQKPCVTGGCPVWMKEWPKTSSGCGASALDDYEQKTQRPHKQIGTSASSSANSDYSQLSSCSSGSTPSQNSYDFHRSTSSSSTSSGNNNNNTSHSDWLVQEIKDPEQTYKLFDMQKFRLQLERTKRRAARNVIDGTTTTPIDWRQCVSIISFDCARPLTGNGVGGCSSRLSNQPPLKTNSKQQQQQQQVLSDPCWLMLINIIAIDMLKSSVCDSTPSPASQTSSLVNRYQNNNDNNNIRAAARKLLPPLPAPEKSPNNEEREQPRANLPAFRNHRAGVKSPTPFAAPDQVVYKSERLRRLNQIRNQTQPDQVTSLSGKQQQNRAPMLPQSRPQHSLNARQQQQPEGSIYTTFTGKYLDKQHRMRADKQRANGQSTAPIRQSSVEDFNLEREPHLVMSKLSRRDASYQNKLAEQGNKSQPLTPVDFARPGRRLSAVTTSNHLRTHLRSNGARHNQHLTHSLSAFDLSHGLKLNLRSINASSIKMNFDDDDEEEFEGDFFLDNDNNHFQTNDEDDDQGLRMDSEHVELPERDDLFSKLDLKPREKTQTSLVRGQQQIKSPDLKANNLEASSEWINLAKKFSLLANSNDEIGGEHQDESGQDEFSKSFAEQNQLGANKGTSCEEVNSVDKQRSDDGDILSESREGQLEAGNKLQQNVSRSSIASSSSGCADNDYFISQSSPSSMSSSTRSNGEELSSQPASSSGIISGSVSDDYERRQMKLADAEIGLQSTNVRSVQEVEQTSKKSTPQPGSKTKQQQSSTTSPTSASKFKLNESQLTTKTGQQRHRSPAMKQAISLSRGYNGKSVDLSPQTALDVAACRDCEHSSQTMEQCDCGVSSCDQMMYAVDQDPSSGICDCFCDCLYHPAEELADSMRPQAKFVHPTRCQDELLCDCGQDVGPLSPSYQVDDDDVEEPIYDHLPRFSVTSPANEKPTSRSNNTRHKPLTIPSKQSGKATRRTRNVDRSRETINEEDYDCIVPLPMSSADRKNSRPIVADVMDKSKGKSISATNLKRTSGWLEGSKYMKLLPRFMSFASSSSSTSSNYANGKQDGPPVKSGTLDRATQMVNKFRRTRSSQNLSK